MLPLADVKHVHLRASRRPSRSDNPGNRAAHPGIPGIERSDDARTANAYDHVGEDYSRYADGEVITDPSASDNRFAHADTIVWETLRRSLDALRESGASHVRVLDAGCGPGVWTKRIADYAHGTGLSLSIIGFDISKTQLEKAREHTGCSMAYRSDRSGIAIQFLEHDLSVALPWPAGHFHIVLCNYVVLNHLTKRALPFAISELCRVAIDRVIATVRSMGSPASACIIGPEQVQEYLHDPERGQLALLLKDGSEHRLAFNIYPAETLASLFLPHAEIVDMRAIDLFLCRFAPDAKWTGSLVGDLPGRSSVLQKLKEMEDALCRSPGWVDHGTHVLIVVRPKGTHKRYCMTGGVKSDGPVASSFAEFLANQAN